MFSRYYNMYKNQIMTMTDQMLTLMTMTDHLLVIVRKGV